SLAIVALAGCATPAPLVRLNPDAADVIWVGGRASVQRMETGVRVAAAFEHQDGRALAVRVEVENGTGDRLEVDPRDITYAVCRTADARSCAPSRRVIDPEQVLAALDTAESRDAADAANSKAFLGTLVLLSAVGDVAAAASGHPGRGGNTVLAAQAMDDHAAAVDSAQASIAVQRQLWSNQALRRNSLFPGQGTSGLVYLPINLQAGFVWLQVTAGGRTFPFHFLQTVTRVAPVTAAARP
ncbi:MAG TPA: hypothetical protein VHO06_26060, partial [Polyangia bacterium]|nr:hypothetical protein [Polyangia bacterium]